MKDTRFAFADAKIRTLETGLLTPAMIEQMLGFSGVPEVAEFLRAHDWQIGEKETDPHRIVAEEGDRLWNEVSELLPEAGILDPLLIPNDFHNLKAALKALVSGEKAERFFIRPTTLDTDRLFQILAEKRYDELPRSMAEAAVKCYDILTSTGDGQWADAVLDRASLETLSDAAGKSDSELMRQYAAWTTAIADCKTAYRAAGKDEEFLKDAICGSDLLDAASLIRAAAKGRGDVLALLAESPLSDAAEKLKVSMSAFEKWADDRITALCDIARLKCFGPDPIVAYYLAKLTEIKTVRILLVCRACGASAETTRERMRDVYV